MISSTLSAAEARRLALAAQGFGRARPEGDVTADHLRGVVAGLGLLQLDFVTVLVPAHYLVPFSRLGAYDRALLDDLAYRRRELAEQWAHEASLVPTDAWPLLAHRRAAHRVRPYGFERVMEANPAYVGWVLEEVRARGALTADQLPAPEGVARRLDQAWFGTVPRAVLEAHFGRGALAIAHRRPDFARAYDLSERVIPAAHHGRAVEPDEAERELLRRAGRALGVATAGDLADYYRVPVRAARPRIAELVTAGELAEAMVEGWREPAYLDPSAAARDRLAAAALLAPFDPLIWYRPRVQRLFGFEYRLEIFVPREQRRWGVYVLPFLLGDRLVARVDLRADRPGRRLVVVGAWAEPGMDGQETVGALAAELSALASWLGLGRVRVERRGGLARPLRQALRA